MSTTTERGIEIHRTMTPHQMAMRIVQLEDDVALAEEAVQAADNLVKKVNQSADEYNRKLDEQSHRIDAVLAKVEDYSELLQQRDELLAEVRKHKLNGLALAAALGEKPSHASIPEGWQLVPVELTAGMLLAAACEVHPATYWGSAYRAMLAAAPKPEGGVV